MSRHKTGGHNHTKSLDQDKLSRAYQLLQAGKFSAAEQLCRDVLDNDDTHADANHCLGVACQRLGHPEKAVALFEKTLAIEPGFIPAYGNLANALAQIGRTDDARRVAHLALELRPELAVANRALGDLAYQVAEYAKSEEFYQRALTADPADLHSYSGRGMALRRLNRLEEALSSYEQALKLQPGNASLYLNRGNLLSDMGRIDDAIQSYRQSIHLKPDYARPYHLLAGVRKHTTYDTDLKAMEALYAQPGLTTEDRMHLAFGLGKAFEDLKQFDKAFGFFEQGNKRKRSMTPYSISEDVKLFDQLKATFTTDFFDKHQGLGSADRSPIFILGLPRSGTSLAEQILAAHPDVHGAGELADLQVVCRGVTTAFPNQISHLASAAWKDLAENYLARLRNHNTSTTHVTDKMPQNFLYIGMIAVMLPNARIIHCRRHPLDTCLSLFKSLFVATGQQWSYDIEDLGSYCRLYQDLMKHWNQTIPGRIYDLHYENLVANPEQQIRKLLGFCEIPFDPACLAFHESKRAVQTLSFAQVRKPIYSSSVQLWKRYEKHLQPLITKLGDT